MTQSTSVRADAACPPTVTGGTPLPASNPWVFGNGVSGGIAVVQCDFSTGQAAIAAANAYYPSGTTYLLGGPYGAWTTYGFYGEVTPGTPSTTTTTSTTTSTSSTSTTTTTQSTSTTSGSGTITIYDHRVYATYWAPCFATACTNPTAWCTTSCTGPGASMWVSLCSDPGCSNVVATGFADEGGHTFTGLTAGATYYIYPSDCDLCHGSTHDVLFDHWGTGGNTRPLAVIADGTSVDAWYTCTNGCGGV